MAMMAIQTPLSNLIIEASTLGLTRVRWQSASDESNDAKIIRESDENTTNYGEAEPEEHRVKKEQMAAHLNAAKVWFAAYFLGKEEIVPPLDYSELSDFSKKVPLQLVQSTRFGSTTTYGELARLLNQPKASRAVGTVMRKNPWPIIVPCHRVLLSNGNIGRYSAGQGKLTKRWLLEHESHHKVE
jgi:O-6-methylguanine DNA methyltransferase